MPRPPASSCWSSASRSSSRLPLRRTGVGPVASGGPLVDAPAAEGTTWGNPLWWVAALLVIWAAYLWHRVGVHQLITHRLTARTFDGARAPTAGPQHESRLAYVEEAQRGNLTVYSQGWAVRPFIGSGRVATSGLW